MNNDREMNKPPQLRGYKPPYMAKVCPKSRRELAKMMHVDKMSMRMMQHQLGVSNTTLNKWFVMFALEPKEFVDYQTIQDAKMIIGNDGLQVLWDEAKVDDAPQDERSENTAIEVRPEPTAPITTPVEELSELDRSWLMLPEKAREVITFISSLTAESTKMTDAQIAERCGIHPMTLTKYRHDVNFKHCLHEAITGNFKFVGTEMWMSDMARRYHAGDKTLTREDRALAARVLGLDKQGMSVNVTLVPRPADARLKVF